MKDRAFLFFREFKWKTPEKLPYPKEGRVYLSVDEKDNFIVPFDDGTGLFLEKDSLTGEYETWDCDVDEVTFDNILELPIKAEDIKMMATVEETGEVEMQAEEDNANIVKELGSSLYMLREEDPDAYEAVVSMVTMIADGLVGGNYIELTSDLSWNPATAKIANVTAATMQIESYLNESNPTKIGDLLNAIYTLTVEIVRKHKLLKSNII